MSVENKVAVITDSGCSIRQESPMATENDIHIAPLDIKFFENGCWTSYEDSALSPLDFYQKMRSNPQLPQTSGAIPGKLLSLYKRHAKENRPVISIHVTSHHSSVWESAMLASKTAKEEHPQLLIDVIDSKQVSLATWFLVEQAATLAAQDYSLEEIKKITLETIPKIEIFTSLSTFDNIVKGGRLSSSFGNLGSKLQLRPIVGIVDGEIKFQSVVRTNKNAQRELTKRVENTKGEIIKIAIIHTNFPEGAEILKNNLSQIYSGEIQIHEAGPVLGVHAGEKGLGIAIQKT